MHAAACKCYVDAYLLKMEQNTLSCMVHLKAVCSAVFHTLNYTRSFLAKIPYFYINPLISNRLPGLELHALSVQRQNQILCNLYMINISTEVKAWFSAWKMSTAFTAETQIVLLRSLENVPCCGPFFQPFILYVRFHSAFLRRITSG